MDDKILKEIGVVAECSEVAVFVFRHHTHMIANQDGSVYSARCSAANAVYRSQLVGGEASAGGRWGLLFLAGA
jgi:hypothetical protein